MNCHISNEINYTNEAVSLISMHYGEEKGYRRWLDSKLKKHESDKEWLSPLVEPLIAIEEEVFSDFSVSENDFRLYFSEKNTSFSSLSDSIAVLFMNIERCQHEMDENEKRLAFASYVLPDFPYVKGADAPDEGQFFRLLKASSAEASCKWDCLEIYSNLTEHMARFRELLAPVIQILKTHEKTLLGLIGSCRPEDPYYLKDSSFIRNINAKELQMDFSVFGFNSVAFYLLDSDPDVGYLHYGLYVDTIIRKNDETSAAELAAADKWKSLSDKNRIKILRLLKEREMFGQELKEALELSNATISHHMNALVVENFVTLRKEGNKVIYSLNRSGIEETLKEMKELLLG